MFELSITNGTFLILTHVFQVYYFPPGATELLTHPKPFFLLGLCGLLTSFTSTLMFTAMGSFFNRISDPDMGGAYLTLLNTIANMGKLPLCFAKMYVNLDEQHHAFQASMPLPCS